MKKIDINVKWPNLPILKKYLKLNLSLIYIEIKNLFWLNQEKQQFISL